VLDTILVLADSSYRARLLAGYGYIYDCMVGTILVTLPTANADVVVYLCLSIFLKGDTVFRAVAGASSAYTSTAEVRHLIVNLYTRGTSFVDDA